MDNQGKENLKGVSFLKEDCVFIFQLNGNWCQGQGEQMQSAGSSPISSTFPEKPEWAAGVSDVRGFGGLP